MAGDVKGFKLPDESIEIRYIKKQTGMISDPRHIAFGGMLEGTYRTYVPKQLRNGNYANVLTNEEKDYLEAILATGPGGLGVYNKGDKNFWAGVKVKLGKEGAWLDLREPYDYIKYKILCSYEDEICMDINETDKKKTYKFVLIRKGDEARQTVKKLDITQEAFKQLGKIEDHREAMVDFLRVSGLNVTDDTSMDVLKAKAGEIVINDPAKFVSILKDPSYATKVLIYKAIMKGEIVKKGSHYFAKSGEALAEPNETPTIYNAVKYLENNLYQDFKMAVLAKIEEK